MTGYTPPLDDMRFVLRHVADLGAIGRLPGYEAATPDLVDDVLEAAAKFAANELAPLNQSGDRQGVRLENGVVRTPDGFKEAYAAFVEGGWNGVPFPEDWGGQGLPWTVATAISEMWHGANMAFGLCPLLTQAGVELLLRFGTDDQKRRYLGKLVSGEWTGSMCLTEPHAGSDVGALRTRAEREGDHYRIRGTKIFITFGEHDYTPNIVHMVLARLPDAPPGTRGISLFLVPKFLVNDDGSLGRRNDLRCVSLEHKLGIHASPTCVMSFGDDEGAIGWLVGEEQGGMRAMFTMMNLARVQVGLEGLAIAERAWQGARTYAQVRVQGARRDGDAARPARIIEHPDVRRMLLAGKVRIEAMRALVYSAAACFDHALRAADPEARRRAGERLDLMTPLVKAWCSDQGFEIASDALQVHGGMGYIEETGAAQHLRDARINMIYEGTNGIQALDLVGRKLALEGGRLPWDWFKELSADLDALARAGHADLAASLRAALEALQRATEWLQRKHVDPDDAAAGATPYLRMFATTVGGFLLARAALAAAGAGDRLAGDKLASARFYAAQLLPPATALLPAITAGAAPLRQRLES
ncbi:MAG TPA: acyl-CoA dehydrogenase [Geminicoccaceae bacterium]|nr:acyl-CoA dehydrogenase [Geminicoccaceae bacterium]